MELRVGACNGQMDLNQQIEEVWKDFESSIALPFSYSRLKPCAYHGPITGQAAADLIRPGHPDFRGEEYARIVFDSQFFNVCDEQKFLTLLHESLHLASFLTYLARMHETRQELVVHHKECAELQGTEFEKCHLAFVLADQLFEADAEFSLKTKYPDRAGSRARFYLGMRRKSANQRRWSKLKAPVQPYALLCERLRLELAALLVQEDTERGEVAAMCSTVDSTMPALDPTARERLDYLDCPPFAFAT